MLDRFGVKMIAQEAEDDDGAPNFFGGSLHFSRSFFVCYLSFEYHLSGSEELNGETLFFGYCILLGQPLRLQ
jgi:hypothetical protein